LLTIWHLSGFTKLFMNYVLVFKVMILRSTLVGVSDWHQVTLNNPSNLLKRLLTGITISSIWWHHSRSHAIRWQVDWILIRGILSRATSWRRSIRTQSVRSNGSWRCIDSIDFKLSEEEYILIVLFQYDLKHKGVQLLISSLILLVMNFKDIDLFNCIQRNGWYGSSQVTDWVIVVLIVPERPGW
jgi:hypothetical protein